MKCPLCSKEINITLVWFMANSTCEVFTDLSGANAAINCHHCQKPIELQFTLTGTCEYGA